MKTSEITIPFKISGKKFTHDEAINLIDLFLNEGIVSKNLSVPPINLKKDTAYIVGNNAKGYWKEREGNIAVYNDGWRFIVPNENLVVWVNDENCLYKVINNTWKKQ